MDTTRKHMIMVLALGWALAGSASAQMQLVSTGDSRGCATILVGLRELEASAHSTLAELQDHRRQAERHAEWFGAEQFDPFIAALREKERLLQETLQEIGSLQCPQTPVSPPG